MRSYVSAHKDEIFDTGAEAILARLSHAAKAIGSTLDSAMDRIAQKVSSTEVALERQLMNWQVELNLAVLWEGLRDDPEQLRARAMTKELMSTIQQQIDLWATASRTFNSKAVNV